MAHGATIQASCRLFRHKHAVGKPVMVEILHHSPDIVDFVEYIWEEMASPPITVRFLLEGAAYALEQAGLLLRDANILYRAGSYGSALALGAFAREELGRYKILLDLRRGVLKGLVCTPQDLRDRCGDHVAKQQAGDVERYTCRR